MAGIYQKISPATSVLTSHLCCVTKSYHKPSTHGVYKGCLLRSFWHMGKFIEFPIEEAGSTNYAISTLICLSLRRYSTRKYFFKSKPFSTYGSVCCDVSGWGPYMCNVFDFWLRSSSSLDSRRVMVDLLWCGSCLSTLTFPGQWTDDKVSKYNSWLIVII